MESLNKVGDRPFKKYVNLEEGDDIRKVKLVKLLFQEKIVSQIVFVLNSNRSIIIYRFCRVVVNPYNNLFYRNMHRIENMEPKYSSKVYSLALEFVTFWAIKKGKRFKTKDD